MIKCYKSFLGFGWKDVLKKEFFGFCFLLLIFPLIGFSFSEIKRESLENFGDKLSVSSPWRTKISFSLQRNALLNSSYTNQEGKDYRKKNVFDWDEKNSLFDFSALYYYFSLNLSYSLKEMRKNWEYSFLEDIELFLNSSLNSSVTGYYSGQLLQYGPKEYIHYALGNMSFGFTMPTYKMENFFSEFSFSFIPYPLSGFSQDAGLLISGSGTISLFYFLKKKKRWRLAFSSDHSLTISEYSKKYVDYEEFIPNTPVRTIQRGSLIYWQNYSPYFPSSIRFLTAYSLGKDLGKTYNHDLMLSVSASWKIKNHIYFNSSLQWKDRLYIYNPDRPSIEKKTDIGWLDRDKYAFSIGGSYSF